MQTAETAYLQAGGQMPPVTHHGVKSAWYHLPSPPQIMTLLQPWLVSAEVQSMPAMHGAAAFAFFLAASDGAAEIAITATATAPASRNLVMDFIIGTPSIKRDIKIACQMAGHKTNLAAGGE